MPSADPGACRPACDRRDDEHDADPLEVSIRAFARMEPGPSRDDLREHLVIGYLPVARRLAAKYRDRGVPIEDLAQVASMGLLKAVDRFDPDYASPFLAYAIPTMQGEVRRHFRDRTWAMRVPRALKERYAAISMATSVLSGRLDRAPRPSEIAAYLKLPLQDVLDGLTAGESYSARSLEQKLGHGDGDGVSLSERLGEADTRLDMVENRDAVRPLLDALPEREKTIIMLRFFGDMSQTQIAERIGVSQMHVSRLISRTLDGLRQQLEHADREALAGDG